MTGIQSIVGLMAMVCGFLITHQPAEAGPGQPAPEFTTQTWVNSEPLRLRNLRGKAVLVEFWTFGCGNCRNVEPYVKRWHQQYANQGLVVIGVHAPEFDHERDPDNVKQYVRQQDIRYAVTIDNDFDMWRRYDNHAWPAIYLIDKRGVIRYVKIGEGDYDHTEQRIQALLAEP